MISRFPEILTEHDKALASENSSHRVLYDMNHLDDAQRSIFSLDDAFVRYEHRKTTAREQVERLVSRLLNHRNESYKLSMGDFDNLPPHKYNTTQLLTEMINPLHERLELLNDSLLTNGLEYVDVPRDGNCFFHAILHTLNRSTDYPCQCLLQQLNYAIVP